MFHRNRKAVIAGLLFIFTLCFSAFAQETADSKLEWEPVEGARSYDISIRRAGEAEPFLTKSVEGNSIEVTLDPGSYEIRIVAYNVFKKATSQGVWSPLNVKVSAEIKSVSVIEYSLYSGSASGFIKLKGQGVLPATVVRLESKGAALTATDVSESAGILSAKLDSSGLAPGTYDLVLENPGGRITRIAGALKVLERVAPVLESVEPGVLANDRVYSGFTFIGKSFEPGVKVCLVAKDGAIIEPSRMTTLKSSEIGATFNLAEKEAGDYEAVVVNPGGLESRIAIKVIDAIAGEKLPEIAQSESGPPVDSVPASAAAEPSSVADPVASSDARSSCVYLGWRPGLIISPLWSDAYRNSFLASALALNLPIGGAFANNVFLRMLSVEVAVDLASYSGITDAVVLTMAKATAFCLSASLMVSWQPIENLALSLNGSGGFGLAVTYVQRDGVAGPLNQLSQDSSVLAGLSASYRLKRFVFGAGADWQAIFYLNVPLHTIRPFVRIGYLF